MRFPALGFCALRSLLMYLNMIYPKKPTSRAVPSIQGSLFFETGHTKVERGSCGPQSSVASV